MICEICPRTIDSRQYKEYLFGECFIFCYFYINYLILAKLYFFYVLLKIKMINKNMLKLIKM